MLVLVRFPSPYFQMPAAMLFTFHFLLPSPLYITCTRIHFFPGHSSVFRLSLPICASVGDGNKLLVAHNLTSLSLPFARYTCGSRLFCWLPCAIVLLILLYIYFVWFFSILSFTLFSFVFFLFFNLLAPNHWTAKATTAAVPPQATSRT